MSIPGALFDADVHDGSNWSLVRSGVGEGVCIIKVGAMGGDKKQLGRHFEVTDQLVSKISRESIDATKQYFRENLTKSDWKLMKKLKDVFGII